MFYSDTAWLHVKRNELYHLRCYSQNNDISKTRRNWTAESGGRGESTAIYGLYGYVPLWGVWFLSSLL